MVGNKASPARLYSTAPGLPLVYPFRIAGTCQTTASVPLSSDHTVIDPDNPDLSQEDNSGKSKGWLHYDVQFPPCCK